MKREDTGTGTRQTAGRKPGNRDPTTPWEFEAGGHMSTTAGSGSILCPYWHAHSAREIYCQTPYGPNCKHILRFRYPQTKEEHLKIWCCGRYTACEWYQAMELATDPDR